MAQTRKTDPTPVITEPPAPPLTLLRLFPNFMTTDSIFANMVQYGAPWTEEIGHNMDLSYFTMFSGIKPPTFFALHEMFYTESPSAQSVSALLWSMYSVPWKRLWGAYLSEYSPLDSFSVNETITREQTGDKTIGRDVDYTSTVDGTDKQTSSSNGTQKVVSNSTDDTTTDSTQTVTLEHGEEVVTDAVVDGNGSNVLNHGETITHDDNLDHYQYGFNSTEKIPTTTSIDAASDVHSGEDKTTTTDHETTDTTVTHSGIDTTKTVFNSSVNDKASTTTDVTTTDTGEIDDTTTQARADKTAENTTQNDKVNESITRTRSGNQGSQSYQDLLLKEFELWKWNFYQQVFEDVDKYLALQYYNSI